MHRRISLTLALALVVPLLVAVPAEATDETCFGLPVNVLGTEGPDVIDLGDGTWGPGPFVVATLGGDDRVIGSSGDDVVCLGDGDDRFRGKGGNDKADGGAGNDLLRGGPGNDTLLGGEGDDEIRGGPGNDIIDGGPGNDLIWGGDGDDDIDGGLGDDVIRGGKGHDLIDGDGPPWIVPLDQAGRDRIYGGTGNDRLYANWTFTDGDNTGRLRGGPGYDSCALGKIQIDCERSERNSSQNGEEWRPMVEEVFGRWGLDQEKCGFINGTEHCVGPQVDHAIAILMCESSGWPWSFHPEGASGLFQNLQVYWSERVGKAITRAAGAGITTTLVPGAYIFDPVANAEVAAFLVYESRETLISGTYGRAGYPNNHPYNNTERGPEPWGHWECALEGPNWLGISVPSWIHPAADL